MTRLGGAIRDALAGLAIALMQGPVLFLCLLVVLLLVGLAVLGWLERRRQQRRVLEAWEGAAESEVARLLPKQREGEREWRR